MDNDEARLLDDVFGKSYNKYLRPVMKKSQNITVTFGLTLNQIMDMVCTTADGLPVSSRKHILVTACLRHNA